MGTRKTTTKPRSATGVTIEVAFAEVVGLIHAARQRAAQVVNTQLTDLYWRIGQYGRGRSRGCFYSATRRHRSAWLVHS